MGGNRHGSVLLAAGLVGLCASCPFELPRGVSCGDAWWDEEYEDCDPSDDERSFIDLCRDRGVDIDAVCDPQTCELSCDVCGDGVRTGAEACDGTDIPAGATCPGLNGGAPSCASDCTLACAAACGNGLLEPGEECDYGLRCDQDADCAGTPNPVCRIANGECMPAAADGQPELACEHYAVTAWNHGKVDPSYQRGEVGRCTEKCVFDRKGCSFCGDDILDVSYQDLSWPAVEITQPAELCDASGPAEPQQLSDACIDLCDIQTPLDPTAVLIRCPLGCADGCMEFDPPGTDVLIGKCCVVSGAFECTPDGDMELDCCVWLDEPDVYPPGLCLQMLPIDECYPASQPLPPKGG